MRGDLVCHLSPDLLLQDECAEELFIEPIERLAHNARVCVREAGLQFVQNIGPHFLHRLVPSYLVQAEVGQDVTKPVLAQDAHG